MASESVFGTVISPPEWKSARETLRGTILVERRVQA
jgi:hypothetical protein